MLETLIKRSGEREAFENSKANGWMLWAGKDVLDRMDWSSIILGARSSAPSEMTTQEWQMHLINRLKARGSQDDGWPYMLMAGRLYTIYLMKKIHGGEYPSLKDQYKKMVALDLMRDMGYSDEDLDYLGKLIDHDRNLELAWSQVEQYNHRYGLKDHVTKESFETPQFTIMRMAMAVFEGYEGVSRLAGVQFQFKALVDDICNPPSPNYAALGTRHFGMASCCLFDATDDAQSIKIAGNIGYDFTLQSGGLGVNLSTRGPGDPVDGGRVMHGGRLNYIRKLVADTAANKQGARGGAINVYDTIYSPEAELSAMMQNPRTPQELRERRMNVTYMTNPFFSRKAARGETYFTFTEYSAPDLYQAFFKADQTEFETLYARYEADPTFKKDYRKAIDTLCMFMMQECEVSTVFWCNPSELNRHSSFKGLIYHSNLCMEISVPTRPWLNMLHLYDPKGDPKNGEVGICNIGSIPVHRLPFNPANPKEGFAEYKRAVRAMFNIIDYAIENSEYHYPAIRTQARSRRNAAVGMSGIATLMAQLNERFDTREGRKIIHQLSERHMFACIEVALEMGIERGNAPWINGPNNDGENGTKWVDGWMPIDTYKKTVDDYVDSTLYFDWEDLRSRVVANKGIRFSSLVAHMPGEQATRKGNGSNSIYPLFALSVDLTDGSSAMPWAALDNDLIGNQYQMAFDMSYESQMVHYGIIQKFTDQAGSYDEYIDRRGGSTISQKTFMQNHLLRVKLGLPTKYYTRSLTEQEGKQKDIPTGHPTCPADGAVIEASAFSLHDAGTATYDAGEVAATKTIEVYTTNLMDRLAAQARAMQEQGEGASCTMDGACGA